MKKKSAMLLYAISWFAIGGWLFYKGIHFLFYSGLDGPLFKMIAKPVGMVEAKLFLLIIGLALGRLKQPLLLRSVVRNQTRIASLEEPIALKNLFTRSYLVLVLVMMGIGMGMSLFGVPPDIRGMIDIAIGGALIASGKEYLKTQESRRVDV